MGWIHEVSSAIAMAVNSQGMSELVCCRAFYVVAPAAHHANVNIGSLYPAFPEVDHGMAIVAVRVKANCNLSLRLGINDFVLHKAVGGTDPAVESIQGDLLTLFRIVFVTDKVNLQREAGPGDTVP